jgi:ATP-binding cassette subfamily B protein
MLSTDQAAKEIRLFHLGPLFIERFKTLREQMRRERLGLAGKSALAEFGTRTAATVAVYGAYGFMAVRTLQGAITLGGLTMYYQAFQRGQGLLQGVFSGIVGLYEHNLYLSDLEEFLKLERRVAEPADPRPVPRPMQRGIAFENVTFNYPTRAGEPILEDISLTIRPGEMIALVGENGAGKTTLIKLLCRLYDPTAGRITWDGVDLRDFDTVALRREISVIFQDYVKYQLTARENIQFGNADLPPDEARVVEAATHSGADPVIRNLKDGYDTVLGKWFDGGEELSIGQWQKVALARAFLRESQVIVLDEPTSAMDAKAEYELFRQFRQLAAGRAAVLISHRFSTVRMADCIYVLEGGRIIERGTHADLMTRNGTYARLFEMQAQHYR